MTALIPDLAAAARAARRSRDAHQHGAAFHLVQQVGRRSGGWRPVGPNLELAAEHAAAALADRLEAQHLHAAAMAEAADPDRRVATIARASDSGQPGRW